MTEIGRSVDDSVGSSRLGSFDHLIMAKTESESMNITVSAIIAWTVDTDVESISVKATANPFTLAQRRWATTKTIGASC